MDSNSDIFLKLTVSERRKGDIEDGNLLVLQKCTAALSDLSEETFVVYIFLSFCHGFRLESRLSLRARFRKVTLTREVVLTTVS